MWWGAIVNRFNIDVERVTVEITGLPEQFDGYTIAQISDLHVGTYGNDTTYLHRVVEAVNSLHHNINYISDEGEIDYNEVNILSLEYASGRKK